MRNRLLDVLRQDYAHALMKAFIPVITVAGSHLGALLGGTVITERTFLLPRAGQRTLDAIRHRNFRQLETHVYFLAAAFLVVNLLVDLG